MLRTAVVFGTPALVAVCMIFALCTHERAAFVNRDFVPQVRLLGDSICIRPETGYGQNVKRTFHGVANVVVNEAGDNCKHTDYWLEGNLERWLGDKKWDVIHFNAGLWDQRERDGEVAVSLEAYERNLREIVRRLKESQPQARLVWATTTPVQLGTEGQDPRRRVQYRAVALKVMGENGVRVNDLATVEPRQPKHDVHYTASGGRMLGVKVSSVLLDELAK